MIGALIEASIYILNLFPSKNGISKFMSSEIIVEGRPKFDFSKKKVTFGTYVLAYIGTTNTMKKRAIPVIALRISKNTGGIIL